MLIVGHLSTSTDNARDYSISIYFASKAEYEAVLAEADVGTALLHAEPLSLVSKSAQLFVAYKFQNTVFDFPLLLQPLKVSLSDHASEAPVYLCQCGDADYAYLQSLNNEYIPRLKDFIKDVVSHPKFRDRTLTSEAFSRELRSSDYLIILDRSHREICIYTVKTEQAKGTDVMRISFNWQSGSLAAIMTGNPKPVPIKNLDQALREFSKAHPCIPPPAPSKTESLALRLNEIAQMLRSTDGDVVWEGVTRLSRTSKETEELALLPEFLCSDIIDELILTLCNASGSAGVPALENSGTMIVHILALLKTIVSASDAGCRQVSDTIMRHMNNHEFCEGVCRGLSSLCELPPFVRMFATPFNLNVILKMFFQASVILYGETASHALGSTSTVPTSNTHMVDDRAPSARSVVMSARVDSKVLTGIDPFAIKTEREEPVGQFRTPITDVLTRQPSHTQESEPATPDEMHDPSVPPIAPTPREDAKGSMRGSAFIPALKIPKPEDRADQIDIATRSLRRHTFSESQRDTQRIPSVIGAHALLSADIQSTVSADAWPAGDPEQPDTKLGEQPLRKEFLLTELAKKLGETYMAADLAGLVALKREWERKRSLADRVRRFHIAPFGGLADDIVEFRQSVRYQVKWYILQALDHILYQDPTVMRWHCPVNMLFSDLVMAHHEISLKNDIKFRRLLYRIFSHYADNVEYQHRVIWGQLTYHMSLDRKDRLRRKFDLLVWRVQNRLAALVVNLANKTEEITTQLKILVGYMQTCHTRVMACQVVDVCMEVLILMKHQLFVNGKMSIRSSHLIPVTDALVELLDEIAIQNQHVPLNDMLLSLFVDRTDNWNWINIYASKVLENPRIEEEILKCARKGEANDEAARKRLVEIRCRIIRHYTICVHMLARQAQKQKREEEKGNQPPQPTTIFASAPRSARTPTARSERLVVADLLRKFEFLVHPTKGHIVRYFNSTPAHDETNGPILKVMLQFVEAFFSVPDSPFLGNRQYIDTFISLHYLSFIKLYHSEAVDPYTMDVCKGHLRCLLMFARHKDQEVVRKFYQLRVMDFLAREVDVEQKIDHMQTRKRSLPPPSEPEYISRNMTTLEGSSLHVVLPQRSPAAAAGNNSTFMTVSPSPVPEGSKKDINDSISSLGPSDSQVILPGTPTVPVAPLPGEAPILAHGKPSLPALPITLPPKSALARIAEAPVPSKPLKSARFEDAAGDQGDQEKRADAAPAEGGAPPPAPRGGHDDSDTSSDLSSRDATCSPPLRGRTPRDQTETPRSDTHTPREQKPSSKVSSTKTSRKSSARGGVPGTPGGPKKQTSFILIPGLKLGADMTNVGQAVTGRDTTIVVNRDLSDGENSSCTDSDRSSELDDPAPRTGTSSSRPPSMPQTPLRTPVLIPGLSLSADLTTDGKAVQGRDTLFGTPHQSLSGRAPPDAGNREDDSEGYSSHNDSDRSSESESSRLDSPFKPRQNENESTQIVPSRAVQEKEESARDAAQKDGSNESDDFESASNEGDAKEGSAAPRSMLTSPTVARPKPAIVPALRTPKGGGNNTGRDSARAINSVRFAPMPEVSMSAVRQQQALENASLRQKAQSYREGPQSADRTGTRMHPRSRSVVGLPDYIDGKPRGSSSARNAVGRSSDESLPKSDGIPRIDIPPPQSTRRSGLDTGTSMTSGEMTPLPFSGLGVVAIPGLVLPAEVTVDHSEARGQGFNVAGNKDYNSARELQLLNETGHNGKSPATNSRRSDPSEEEEQHSDDYNDYRPAESENVGDDYRPGLALPSRVVESDMPDVEMNGNVKFQLLNDDHRHAAKDELEDYLNAAIPEDTDAYYATERNNRKLYHDKDLHIGVLQLIFHLLITAKETLQPLYSSVFPSDLKQLNVLFYLHMHINHPANVDLVPELCARTAEIGGAPFRLLKLLCNRMFNPNLYKGREKLGEGYYGCVYKTRYAHTTNNVAIKLIPLPANVHARCVIHDIFTEILILDRVKHDNRAVHMFDFGVDSNYYYISMRHYPMSLGGWRKRQTGKFAANRRLYLNVFYEVLKACGVLEAHKINHFDIKADNFLICPRDPATPHDEIFRQANPEHLNFTVSVGDFGESLVYFDAQTDGVTLANLGTEFIKSPEMLTVAYYDKTVASFDRRRMVGANNMSDIWSIGCLLYEVLAGSFLFQNPQDPDNWGEFYYRVTTEDVELIPANRRSLIDDDPDIVAYLNYVLVRDPDLRPSLDEITRKFEETFDVPFRHTSRNSEDYSTNRTTNRSAAPRSGAQWIDAESRTERDDLRAHTFSSSDLNFFLTECSMVVPEAFLAAENVAKDKTKLRSLGITHVVNCSSEPYPHLMYFDVLDLLLNDDDSQDLLSHLPTMVDFVRSAVRSGGKVLFYSGSGISVAPAVLMGYLMESRAATAHEALTMILQRRFIVNPRLSFMEQLGTWDKQLQRRRDERRGRLKYRCLCGANVVVLKDEFSRVYEQNPMGCTCSIDKAGVNCPNVGCANFLSDMRLLWDYKPEREEVIWGYTYSSDLIDGVGANTVEFNPMLSVREIMKHAVLPKQWRLFRCRTCHFLTHAVSFSSSDFVALVCNIPVDDADESRGQRDLRRRDFFDTPIQMDNCAYHKFNS